MSETKQEKSINWIQVGGFILAIIVFIFGSGYIYNEIWKSKVLTYTVLPQYDLDDQAFSGLIIENRGRTQLTDIEVIISEIEPVIEKIKFAGPHETAEILEGSGEGLTHAKIIMGRLSRGKSLTIYMITSGAINFEEGINLLVTSNETPGVLSGTESSISEIIMFFLITSAIIFDICIVVYTLIQARSEKRNDRQSGIWD